MAAKTIAGGYYSRMLPPFDAFGNLPRGIHRATVEDVAARFGRGSPEREVEIRELQEFVSWARSHGVQRLIVNGSFVTNKLAPNDVDIVVLPRATRPGEHYATVDFEPAAWPFLQILVAADDADLEGWATQDFATDRQGRDKGVVEVIL